MSLGDSYGDGSYGDGSYGDDFGSAVDYETLRGRDYPSIRQFTVFLENRVGQLLELTRRFEGSRARIVAVNIADSTECSIVRFVLSHPEQGREVLERAGHAMIESDLIGVLLPSDRQPLLRICTALLQAEVNLVSAYPLLVRPGGKSAVALMVDNIDLAVQTLTDKKISMVTEQDLIDALDEDQK